MATTAYKTPAASYTMLPVPEALAIVMDHTDPLPAETVTLSEAYGRVLTEDVAAADPLPPFRASIKDGYAVASADGPGDYPVAFEAYAGSQPPVLQPGTVAYIGTGGPVPEGADAVVQIEDTATLPDAEDGSTRVRINLAAQPGLDIRPVGSDMAAGAVVLPAGTRVNAAEIGILATVGAARVSVHQTPLVAVLSTGDEVQDVASGPLGPGQIRDANRDMLLAAARGEGAQVLDLGIARDREGSVEGAVEAALAAGAAVLLTSGGVSMGDKDLVKGALEARGRVMFGKILMKPGKPLTFAKIERGGEAPPMLVFGLPGNPVSSIVTFYLFVAPTLRKLQGWKDPGLQRIHVSTASPLKLDPVRPEYHRAIATWEPPYSGSSPTHLASTSGSCADPPATSTPPSTQCEVPATGTATAHATGAAAVPNPNAGPQNGPASGVNAPATASGSGADGGAGSSRHSGLWVAASTGGQLSSRLLSMRSANVLLELPRASGVLPAGSVVSALVIGQLGS